MILPCLEVFAISALFLEYSENFGRIGKEILVMSNTYFWLPYWNWLHNTLFSETDFKLHQV